MVFHWKGNGISAILTGNSMWNQNVLWSSTKVYQCLWFLPCSAISQNVLWIVLHRSVNFGKDLTVLSSWIWVWNSSKLFNQLLYRKQICYGGTCSSPKDINFHFLKISSSGSDIIRLLTKIQIKRSVFPNPDSIYISQYVSLLHFSLKAQRNNDE